MKKDEFIQTYCNFCGTQRCEGINTVWFTGCPHKNELEIGNIQKIILDGGKYTVIYDETNSFPEKCLRYGEDWRDLVGDNLIFYLCNKIKELKEKIDKLENEIEDLNEELDYYDDNFGNMTI